MTDGQQVSTIRRFSSVPLIVRRGSRPSRISRLAAGRALITVLRDSLSSDATFLYTSAFLLGRISLFGQYRPFGVALAAALLGRPDKDFYASSILVSLGILSAHGGWGALEYLIVLGLMLLGRPLLQEKEGEASAALLTGAVAATALFVGRVAFALTARGSLLELGFLVAEAVLVGLLAFLACYVIPAVRRPLDESALGREETIGIVLLLAILATGLDGVTVLGVPLAETAIRWMVVVAAYCSGVGAGAAMGTAGGVVGSMLGNTPFYFVPGYALAGVVAGVFRELGRFGAAIGFAIGTALLAYQIPEASELTAVLLATFCAVAGFLFTPESLIRTVGTRVNRRGGLLVRPESPLGIDHRMQDAIALKLDEFAKVFRELAKTFRFAQGGVEQRERTDFATVLEEIADRACATCDKSVMCWKEHFHLTYQELLEFLATAEMKGTVTAADAPEEFAARCPQVGRVVAAVNQLMELNTVNNVWERRVAESKQIVYGQLTGVAEIMQNLAREAKIEPAERGDLEREIAAALRRERVPVERVLITRFDDERTAVEIGCRACGGVERCRRQVPLALNRVCREVYSLYQSQCGQEAGKSSCQLRYLPERAFDLVARSGKAVKDGNAVSGDNYAVLDLPGGKTAVVLSDGMGMGARAALESSATIDMLAQLMKAGFEREFAVRTVNSILLLRSQEESFATVDMLLFDLYSGEAEFVKIGACPSYIVRGREVQQVAAASVPIGILSNIDVEVTSRYLRPGDLVVMATDGLGEAPTHGFVGDWIAHSLRNCALGDPDAVAQHLLAQARQLGGGKVEDDMTVLVCQVQRRADYCLPQPLSHSWRQATTV